MHTVSMHLVLRCEISRLFTLKFMPVLFPGSLADLDTRTLATWIMFVVYAQLDARGIWIEARDVKSSVIFSNSYLSPCTGSESLCATSLSLLLNPGGMAGPSDGNGGVLPTIRPLSQLNKMPSSGSLTSPPTSPGGPRGPPPLRRQNTSQMSTGPMLTRNMSNMSMGSE